MASTSSISGLVSGLDTDTLVKQLMQVAAAPQTRLKSTLSRTTAQITAAQSINTKTASMTSLAADLAGTALYTTAAAKSSSSSVSATVTGSPPATSLTFSVTQLASAFAMATGHLPAPTTGSTTFTLTGHDGTAHPVTAASNSPADLVKAINASGAGVSATSITDTDATGNPATRLVLTSKTTGSTSGFTVSGLGTTEPDVVLRNGYDATVDLGGGITVSSATGTFTNLIDGVSITPSALADNVTVSTATDTSAISAKVTGLVASMNAVLGDITFHTKAPAAGVTASATNGGLLVGNSTMRDLSGSILDAVSGRIGGNAASQAGLAVTREGTVTFDATKFSALYASDPAKAQAVLQAVAAAVQGVGKTASSTGTGTVTSLIAGLQSTTKDLTSRISDWDVKLTAKQATLKAQYDALETALQRVKSQGDALTQALSGLTSSN